MLTECHTELVLGCGVNARHVTVLVRSWWGCSEGPGGQGCDRCVPGDLDLGVFRRVFGGEVSGGG